MTLTPSIRWSLLLSLTIAPLSAFADHRDECKKLEGVWISQTLPKSKTTTGICLDGKKSQDFGTVNEAPVHMPTSLPGFDIVLKKEVHLKDVFKPGIEVVACNFTSEKFYHGGPAASAYASRTNNTLPPGECKEIWTPTERKNYYPLTAIWTPKDAEAAYKAFEKRVDEDWMDDPANPGKKIRKPIDTGVYRNVVVDGKAKQIPEAEYQKNKHIYTGKKKNVKGGRTGGTSRKSAGSSSGKANTAN